MISIVTGVFMMFSGFVLFFLSNGSFAGSLFAVGIALIAIGIDTTQMQKKRVVAIDALITAVTQMVSTIDKRNGKQ